MIVVIFHNDPLNCLFFQKFGPENNNNNKEKIEQKTKFAKNVSLFFDKKKKTF